MSVRDLILAASGASGGVPVGQIVFEYQATEITWTVPAGVTSISAVLISNGGNTGDQANVNSVVSLSRGSTVIVAARYNSPIGDGKFSGGPGGLYDDESGGGGGGGAAGYAGNGGNGGYAGIYVPTPGTGGGGGGGAGGGYGNADGYGGGVGLLGQGDNGAAGTRSSSQALADGKPGSSGVGKKYGGGSPRIHPYGGTSGGGGGHLAYKNNITVTPGEVIKILFSALNGNAGMGAVRIIWGPNRSFPSTNTGDM